MGSDRAAQFSNANALTRLRESLFRAAEFIEHQRQLYSKGDRLGVNPVTAPDHWSFFVAARLFANCFSQCRQIVGENLRRLSHLHRKSGIENIGGS